MGGTVEITLLNGGKIGIGNLPDRKRKALYRERGCQIEILAYFKSDEDAEWMEGFLEKLCRLANGEREP
jgi:hypothetical protein